MLEELQQKLGYTFVDQALLKKTMTHSTYANENAEQGPNYERLEFLGDAVLDLLVARLLFQRFEDAAEGELSRRRARVVRRETLTELAKGLDLAKYVLLGSGQLQSGPSDRILADSYEALVGAVYLDGGHDAAAACFSEKISEAITSTDDSFDFKTQLQELCHRLGLPTPRYDVVATEGPDHARLFTCAVVMGDKSYGSGVGSSKKIAEQQCAAQAIEILERQ